MTAPPRREPQRTCVGCRGRAGKAGLVRVVRSAGGSVLVDPAGRSPGRGAYVHPSAECVTEAVRRGSLARALRASLGAREVGRLVDELRTMVGEEL